MNQSTEHCCLKAVDGRENIEALYKQFQIPLPGDSLSPGDSRLLVGVLVHGDQEIGMAAGYLEPEKNIFSVLLVYLERDWRSTELVCFTIEQLLRLAEEVLGAQTYVWKYEVSSREADSFLNLIRRIPGYEARVHEICEMNLVSTQDFSRFRHSEEFYGRKTMEKKGFQIVLWKDCKEEIRKQFEAMQSEEDPELEGLLPFVGEEFEAHTSMVVLEKSTGKVASWMICKEAGPEEIEIRRWYTPEQFRESRIGLIFGAYMLGILGKEYRFIRYQMRAGNRSMEGFTSRYFGKAIIGRSYKRYLEIVKKQF